jgi:hypothetical protein
VRLRWRLRLVSHDDRVAREREGVLVASGNEGKEKRRNMGTRREQALSFEPVLEPELEVGREL